MAAIKIEQTGIEGLVIVHPQVFGDERGYFMETYNQQTFNEAGLDMVFVQDNESRSRKGVLRGLHFQTKHSQGKLVRATEGTVWDVGVDLRAGSPTYGKWAGVTLSAENHTMFYIPEGFAHGFVVLSSEAELLYKASGEYNPLADRGILWNDKDIDIDWEIDFEPILSDKDLKQPCLKEIDLGELK